jgi:hypothetical protein
LVADRHDLALQSSKNIRGKVYRVDPDRKSTVSKV